MAQEVKGSTLTADALQLPNEVFWFEWLTTDTCYVAVLGRLFTHRGGA